MQMCPLQEIRRAAKPAGAETSTGTPTRAEGVSVGELVVAGRPIATEGRTKLIALVCEVSRDWARFGASIEGCPHFPKCFLLAACITHISGIMGSSKPAA